MGLPFQFLASLECGHKRKVTTREQTVCYCLDCDAHVPVVSATASFSYDRDKYKGYKKQ
jgi:hypothetical protein